MSILKCHFLSILGGKASVCLSIYFCFNFTIGLNNPSLAAAMFFLNLHLKYIPCDHKYTNFLIIGDSLVVGKLHLHQMLWLLLKR